jgi:cell division protease FtsH
MTSNDLFDASKSPSEIIKSFYGQPIGNEWTYSEFFKNIDHDKVGAVSILSDNKHAIAIDNNIVDNSIHSVNIHSVQLLPNTYDNLITVLTNKHINVDSIQLPDNLLNDVFAFLGSVFSSVSTFLIIYTIISFAGRAFFGNKMPPNIMSNQLTDNNSGDLVNAESLNVTFADVAGCDEAKFELMEVVDYLKNSTKYDEIGAKVPRGVLLEGNPGTGKTLLARAVAAEAGVPFISVSGSEFIEMFVGVGASRVRNLFDKARKNAPCVVFIDEIDAIGRQRGAGIAGGNDEREQTLNQILTNMDGFQQNDNIVVLAATNRIDILDSALTRPGRFDRKVRVGLPDFIGRKQIAKVHLRNKKVDKSVDFDELSSLTPGFSGADLANLANEAAILTVRQNKTTIDRKILFDAYEKMTIGLTSYNQDTDENIIELVSYHETGHALMVALFPDFFDLRKVTINANKNGAGGYTLFTPNERYQKYATKKFILANLIIALGGRAAEVYLNRMRRDENDLFINSVFKDISDLDITTGASNDLFQANRIARDFITKYGFGPDLGMYDESMNNDKPFIGRDMGTSGRRASEATKYNVDIQAKELVCFAYQRAYELITSNQGAFTKTVESLKSKRIISGDDVKKILDETSLSIK